MRKSLVIVSAVFSMLTGCAIAPFQPGTLYSQQKMPVSATNHTATCAKKGTGSAVNVLGLVAFGDASIAAAKKSAGIVKVDTVDVSHFSILGLFGTATTEVCGE